MPVEGEQSGCFSEKDSGSKSKMSNLEWKRDASAGLTPLPIPETLLATRRTSMWADFAWQKSNYY